ncbi:MAG: metallophosphoesterase [Bacilli bacterium]|nr:metallophosphoesterase [Bacilli bacterium]MBQ3307562.1 metallophosphoesterase [Bacilli bacterium]
MKIIFVGDTHLTANCPSSRKETNEEYRELQYKKLNYIYNELANEDDIVIITGDVFHSSALSMMAGTPKFYNDIIDLMNTRKTYTIVGNHDMYFRNEDVNNTTILDNLLKAGVEHLDTLQIPIKVLTGSTSNSSTVTTMILNIYGVDYSKDFPQLLNPSGCYNIIVAHSFFEDSFYGTKGNENLTIDAINNQLGKYDAVVLGHDHTPYSILEIDNPLAYNRRTKIIRPGSLMRGTSHTCQVNRIPQVAVFNTEDLSWKYEQIPVAPGQEVFKEKVILEKELDVNVESILKNMNSYDKSIGIYKFIKSQEARGKEVFGDRYYDIVNIIKQYLNTYGFIEGGNNDNK